MDVWLVVVIIFCMALGFVALALVLLGRIKQLERSDTAQLLKADLTELNRSIVSMQERVGDKLEQGSVAMQTSMQKQLTQSAKLVADVSNRLTKLDETNARVVGVADELKTLQNVLQNPKQRGVFGEFYLESVLDNVLGPKQFQMQYKFKDGAIADAVIFLEKGRVLPIDSKFSLENYNRMVSTKDKEERAR